MNCECYCVTEIDGEYYTDCEVYGVCTWGEVPVKFPERQLDKFKDTTEYADMSEWQTMRTY